MSGTEPDGTSAATSYTYDADGELTGSTQPGGRVLTYSYNANGDRTTTTDSAATPTTTSYEVNGYDEYTSANATGYTYDADGNLASETSGGHTTTYTWNDAGDLAQASGPTGTTTYTYDGLGTLISEDVNGTVEEMLMDPGVNAALGQYNGSGAAVAYYPNGLGVVGQVSAAQVSSPFAFDGSGNVVSVSDPSGAITNSYAYLPFGQLRSSTGTTANPFQFQGQFGIATDPGTGFTENGARNYDPTTGRFISQDPDLLSGPNPYDYAGNEPVDGSDLTGEFPDGDSNWFDAGQHLSVDPVVINTAKESGIQLLKVTGDTLVGASLSTGVTQQQAAGSVGAGAAVNLTGVGLSLVILTSKNPLATNAVATPISNALVGLGLGVSLYQDYQLYTHEGANAIDHNKAVGNSIRDLVNAGIAFGIGKTPFSPSLLLIMPAIQASETVVDDSSNFLFDYYYHGHYQPHDVFGPTAKKKSQTLTSTDPNDMIGPDGFGSLGYVPGGSPLRYQVDFTNEPTASVPAQTVTVTESLDPNVDLSTFSLGSFGFGYHVVTPPTGLRSYSAVIDDTTASDLDVDVTASLDSTSRIVTWTFTSVDPQTGLPTADAADGFLPPDTTAPEGEGFVSYLVSPAQPAVTGTTVSAQADVMFDTNAPLSTTTVSNTLDSSPPTASVDPCPRPRTDRSP